jgi:hypothetical protein
LGSRSPLALFTRRDYGIAAYDAIVENPDLQRKIEGLIDNLGEQWPAPLPKRDDIFDLKQQVEALQTAVRNVLQIATESQQNRNIG